MWVVPRFGRKQLVALEFTTKERELLFPKVDRSIGGVENTYARTVRPNPSQPGVRWSKRLTPFPFAFLNQWVYRLIRMQRKRFWIHNNGTWVLPAMVGLMILWVGRDVVHSAAKPPAVRKQPISARKKPVPSKKKQAPTPTRKSKVPARGASKERKRPMPRRALPAKRAAKLSWAQTLEAFVAARKTKKRKALKGAAKLALMKREVKRWRALLIVLKRKLPQLSRKMLVKTRKVLEIEGDRDRNRFFQFPSKLSMKIIKTMIAIDLRRGAYPKPRPTQHHHHAHKHKHGKGSRYMMGETGPSPQYWLKKTKPPVDESKLPPLVFRQKDLERFKTSRTLISWPMARRRVGSGFGWRRDPFTKKLRFHNGIDIGAPHGTPVWAAAGGYVWRTGWLGSCGLGVLLRHRKGMMTYYCHLSQILAPVGKWVKRRQVIGKIGSTGRSTSPHLHFSLVLRGKPVNPLAYLPR